VKRSGVAGFLFGCFAPLVLFVFALQGPPLIATLAQKFIEFTYVGVQFFDAPFGMLNAWERILVVISGGLIWALIFMIVRYFRNQRKS